MTITIFAVRESIWRPSSHNSSSRFASDTRHPMAPSRSPHLPLVRAVAGELAAAAKVRLR